MQEEIMSGGHHSVSMNDCARLCVGGVKEIISFDEMTVVLVTYCGTMTVEGEGLHISGLDLERGEANIDGAVSGIFYTKMKEKSGGFFKRGRER